MELAKLKLTAKRKTICDKLGLKDSDDILSYYPFRYENYQVTPICDFIEGGNVFFEAELLTYPSTFRYGRKSRTSFKVLYEDEELSVSIFNRPWLKGLDIGDKIVIAGKYDGNHKITANQYYLKSIEEIKGIIPVYPSIVGIGQHEIRKLIESVYGQLTASLEDDLPLEYIQRHRLVDYRTAISNIHFPKSEMLLKMALARLKYEEFVRFYLAMELIRDEKVTAKKGKSFDERKLSSFIDNIGFTLTDDQKKATREILADIKSSRIMYRLLQGEVGSGKTAVAMIAFYANYLAGYQGAFMAPTEILAKQHYESINGLFGDCRIALLTGSSKNSDNLKKEIADGNVDLVIGTHSLFQDDVSFKKLGLVVADEQQRFGVKQRRKLKNKGPDADFLMMSATPIPRTLASSIYGDMDVSTIEVLPAGRKGCDTYLIKENSLRSFVDAIRKTLEEGQQIYIIGAAIDHNDNTNIKDVRELSQAIGQLLKEYRVECLHGRLSDEEKETIMARFHANEVQVLVSTTVVEVGVNVPNATMMIIYDADRFGLSQLHQLRGRVQRGNLKGSCYLLTASKDKDVIARLSFLANCNDGFEISKYDLKTRGPGDLLGYRQSGLPPLVLGNLLNDEKISKAARADAHEIIGRTDDFECQNLIAKLKAAAFKKYID